MDKIPLLTILLLASTTAKADYLGANMNGITANIQTQINAKQTSLGYTPVNKAGDTMSGLLTLSGEPTTDSHAATKAYVDAASSGPSTTATYSATTGPFTPAASATDVFEIYGSATKTVQILKIYYSWVTSTGVLTWNSYIIKRSTANSAGTAVTATAIPLDSNDAAATAVVKHYTANPTLGTGLGNLIVHPLNPIDTQSLNTSVPPIALFDADKFGKPITLRGTGQGVVINGNSVSLPNTLTSLVFTVVWTEQ